MQILNGRPQDDTGRLPRETRVYDLLDKLDIPFIRIEHPPLHTMEDCVVVDDLFQMQICKNLFLCNRQKTQFYLLLMPASKPFVTKELSKQIASARLSFAGPELLLQHLDIEPGAVSVMGLMNDAAHSVRLLIDDELLPCEWFGCHPCVNTASIKFKTADLLEKFLPAVGHEFTAVHLTGEA